jgi:hypothetical protein
LEIRKQKKKKIKRTNFTFSPFGLLASEPNSFPFSPLPFLGLEARFAPACILLYLFAWAEPSRAVLSFRARVGRPRSYSRALPPSLVSLMGGTRRSAASSLSFRYRAGVMVPTEQNPELHGILF